MKKAIIIVFLFGVLSATLLFGGCGTTSDTPATTTSTVTTTSQTTSTATGPTTTTTFALPTTATFEPTAVEVETVTVGASDVTREVINNKVIVSLVSGQTEDDLSSTLPSGYSIIGSNSLTGVYEVQIPASTSLNSGISAINALSATSTAGADYVINNYFTPNDYAFSNSLVWGHTSISIEAVWDITTGDENIKVSVVDGGIDYGINGDETDVYNNDFEDDRFMQGGWDFVHGDAKPDDEIGHGTAVTGIFVANGNNTYKTAGMNWNSQVWIHKVTGFNQKGSTTALANAVSYAARNGCKVINSSVGVILDPTNDDDWQLIQALADAADVCYQNNAIWVCAAGNENLEVSGGTSSPQVYPAALAALSNSPVIAVGAYNQSEARWTSGSEGSNYGDAVEICAPGESIYTTQYGNSTQTAGKTSLASPFVAGVASLLYSIGEEISASPGSILVKQALINGGDTISTDQDIGKKLNAFGAVLSFLDNYNKTVVSVSCNVAGATVSIGGEDTGKTTTTEGYTRVIASESMDLVTIQVAKSGYETYSAQTSVIGGVHRVINVTLSSTTTTTTTTTTTSTTATITTTTSTSTTTVTTTSTTSTTATPVFADYEFGAYNYYDTPTTETISIPSNAYVYIGNLTTEAGEKHGFFDCGYAGYLNINGTTAAYNRYYSGSPSGTFSTYYGSSSGNYIYITTEATSTWAKYLSGSSISADRLWIAITNLVNLGESNSFTFRHSTGNPKGFIVRVSENAITTTTSTTTTTTTTTSTTTTTAVQFSLAVIDNDEIVGEYNSIGVDSNDKVHISYYDLWYSNLKYATNSSGFWVTTTLESAGNVGMYTSIALDSNDIVHISFYDATNDDLKYISGEVGAWITTTLESTG